MKNRIKVLCMFCAASAMMLSLGACKKASQQAPAEQQAPAAAAPSDASGNDAKGAVANAEAPKESKETAAVNPTKDVAEAPEAIAEESNGDADDEDSDDNVGQYGVSHIIDWDRPESSEELKFGKRHEIKGDVRPELWADLEPKLPVSVLKVAPDKDVIVSIEEKFNLYCSAPEEPQTAADQSTVQMIICSKRDRPTKIYAPSRDDVINVARGFFCNAALTENAFKTGNADEICDECPALYADVVYLSLVSPEDKNARIYKIDEEIYHGLIHEECMSFSDSYHYSIEDVQSIPFMGTEGLYVRTLQNGNTETEHYGSGDDGGKLIYTTWLFAGDKHRLVTHWTDSEFKYDWHYSTDDSACEEEGATADCMEMKTEGSEEYTESYMFYNNGEFKAESRKATNAKEMKDIVAKRP